MRNPPFNQIVALLEENNIQFELVEHEPVFTSGEAAKVRGFSLKQGAKSLIIKSAKGFIMAVLPGDKRIDAKKLKKILGVKDLRFATPEEVYDVTGVKIGAVYPFGMIAGLEMIVDESLAENELVGFNPGVHDKSIKMRFLDFLSVTQAKIVSFIQD